MPPSDGTYRQIWAWLEAATADGPDPRAAAARRRELYDHIQEIAEALCADGWDPDAAAAEAIRRMGDPVRVRQDWARRLGDRRVFGGTLALLAAALGIVGALGRWPAGDALAGLFGLVAGAVEWRIVGQGIRTVWRGWLALRTAPPATALGAGWALGCLLGTEPLWAGQWLDYVWHGWVLPFGVVWLGVPLGMTWRGRWRPGVSPVTAVQATAAGLIAGLLAGVVVGVAGTWVAYTHGRWPLESVLPDWPWSALQTFLQDHLPLGIGVYLATVLGSSGWVAQPSRVPHESPASTPAASP